MIDETSCPTCKRMVRIRADGHTLYTHGPRTSPCPGSREPFAPVEPAPVEPTPVATCTHRTGNPGCHLVTCYGVPTVDQVESATADPLTPTDSRVAGEYGACLPLRELRDQLRRALPGADVSMPTRSDSRHAYGEPVRELYRITVTVAGRAVTVVAYMSRGPLSPLDWHYAVVVDGYQVTADVHFDRRGYEWWRIALAVRDHIDATATDDDQARNDAAMVKAHATTWALGRWPADVALAYGDWFAVNGDPDSDHSAHVTAFHADRPDMIDQDGRAVEPTPDTEPVSAVAVVEPTPVAPVEPAPVAYGTDPATGDLTVHAGEPAPVEPTPVAPVERAPLPGFSVPRTALADALAYLVTITARVAVPVLAGVVLDASPDGTVTLSTFDYEQHRSYRITGADVATPGTGLVMCRTLADMVKAFPKGVDLVTVAPDGARITVAGGTRRYTIPTLPVEDYPTLPDAAPTVGTVALAPFVDAVTRVAVAAGRDDTLPILTGLMIQATGPTLSLAATDRYRLTLADVPWSPVAPDAAPLGMLPIARALVSVVKVYGKAAGKTGGTLTIGATPGIQSGKDYTTAMLSLAWGPYRLTTRCLDGEFPTVRALLPDGYGARATVTAAALKETVAGVAVVAERSTPVRLTVDTDTVTLAAGGTEDATAVDQVPCTVIAGQFVGEKGKRATLPAGFTVAFNHQYLLDGIAVVGSPELTLSVTDPRKPVVLDAVRPDGIAVTYLIMPVRIGDGAPVEPTPAPAPDAVEPTPDVAPVEPTPESADTTPAEPVAPVTAEQEGSAMQTEPVAPVEPTPAPEPVDLAPVAVLPTDSPRCDVADVTGGPATVPAYERAALDARRLFDAGRYGDALETLATVPDAYQVSGRRPASAIRAHITRAAVAAGRLDPDGSTPEPVAPVAVVEPAPVDHGVTVVARTGNGRPVIVAEVSRVDISAPVEPTPEPVAPVEPAAPAVADPIDAVAVVMAESAAVATLAAEPVATPLYPSFKLPGFALLSAGGSSYRQERRNVRKALHSARYGRFAGLDQATGERVAAILADVVCHVEAVDGFPARFTVQFSLPTGADPVAVRRAVDQVVTAATVTVVESIPGM